MSTLKENSEARKRLIEESMADMEEEYNAARTITMDGSSPPQEYASGHERP